MTVVLAKKWVRGAIAGYLTLLIGVGYAIHENRVQADRDAKAIAAQAERATAALTENRVAAVKRSCAADKGLSDALRRAIDGQIAFVRASNEPGPPSIEQRVMSLEKLRDSIPVPNCRARIDAVKHTPGG